MAAGNDGKSLIMGAPLYYGQHITGSQMGSEGGEGGGHLASGALAARPANLATRAGFQSQSGCFNPGPSVGWTVWPQRKAQIQKGQAAG